MSLLKKLIFGGFGVLVSSDIIEHKMIQHDAEIFEPVDMISIVMPCFNEEKFVEIATSSIRHQSIFNIYPEMFEFMFVDSGSTDNTVSLAEPYVDRILITPRGKLTSRNIATNEAKGNIIVSVDADTYYPPLWLNTLLEPFNNLSNPDYENVVAVSGSTFDYSINHVPGPLFSLGDFLYNKIINTHRIVGRNSAYLKHVHYLAGGFDETVNQSHISSLFREEEGLYGQRLSRFGKVIYKLSASCCHLGGSKSMKRIINNKEYKKDRDTF